ncbi:MAG: hypothetical protein DWP92_04160 [Armatimonadetes bacterium]|nr:MAG: hypothetical protein DWP92_04160 [Armatimonadota bacterium]
MGFLSRLFGRRVPEAAPSEHAVIAHLKLSDEEFGTGDQRASIQELSSQLEQSIAEAAAGEFDGDEFGAGRCTLYMYGRDADLLFAAVEQQLRASPHATGGFVIKRSGSASDPCATEVRIEL